MDREAFDKILEDRREESIDKLKIRLRSEGMRFDKVKSYVEDYKKQYFTKKSADYAYQVECVDISKDMHTTKLYQPNVLERRFRRGTTTRSK